MTTSTLVERLRSHKPFGAGSIMDEAADEIERLRTSCRNWKAAIDKNALASADEIERLRAALAGLLSGIDDPELIDISDATTRARAALRKEAI